MNQCDECGELGAIDRTIEDKEYPDLPWQIGTLCDKCWEKWRLENVEIFIGINGQE
jgi:hypothetical protein